MKVAIITDSNSGMTRREGEQLGVSILPMPIIINGTTYFEGVDLYEEEFYNALTEGKEVFTSQPAPGEVMKLWYDALQEGYDEIVYIPMSSGLSNSCQTAIALSEDFQNKVHVVDNQRISATQRSSVLDALSLRDKGLSALEIKNKLEEDALAASIYIAVDTMEFLKKGGRVTPAAATLGALLNIKPILQIQGEKLDAYAKVRGIKKCRRVMIEAVKNDLDDRFCDINKDELQILIAGSFRSKDDIKDWENEISYAFPDVKVAYESLTFSIGCHVGPDAFGIGIVKRVN